MIDFAALSAPFSPDAVSWRVGSMTKDKTKAKALAYIDARDVMQRLDAVCGPAGWQAEYTPMPNGTTCCRLGLQIGTEWIWKANGAGATDVEGDKGAYSDAFKRAAVLWGVGQYLYGIDSPWVRINEYKQIEQDELPKLRALLLRNGEAQASSRSLRQGDAWKEAIAGLNAAIQTGAVAEYCDTMSATVARWPDKWQEAWREKVAAAVDMVAA